MVGGPIKDVTTLDTGSLISGSLAFLPGQLGLTINGQVQASLTEVEPQFIESNPAGLDVNFVHPVGEYVFTSPLTLQITGGTSSSATIVSSGGGSGGPTVPGSVAVPEPASAALLGLGMAAAAVLRGRRRAAPSQQEL